MSGFRPRFFADQESPQPSDRIAPQTGTVITLGPGDSHHASRVLRLKVGDACEVVWGAAVYAASVSSAEEPVRLMLTEKLEGEAAGALYRSRVGLIQALTRPALIDEILEKGTEVGADFFVLMPAGASTRLPSEARASRLERWRRIVLEAAKQSKRLTVPSLVILDSMQAAQEYAEATSLLSLVLDPSAPVSLAERLVPLADGPGVALWIGPESGWSEAELQGLSAAGMGVARLGQSILRAETAGPVAVAVARSALRDW